MTTPLSFRSIFKEKGSFSNLTVYFALEAFDVALGIGTGTSYLFFLASQSYGSKQSPVSILTLEKKTQCRDEIWLLISCHASHVQPLQVYTKSDKFIHYLKSNTVVCLELNIKDNLVDVVPIDSRVGASIKGGSVSQLGFSNLAIYLIST